VSDDLSFDVTLNRRSFQRKFVGSIPLRGITALTGRSGAGKTTLLRVLAGLEPTSFGQIHFGEDVWQRDGWRRSVAQRGIGFVFQNALLFPTMNVAENLRYGASRRGSDISTIVDALDLAPLLNRKTDSLSGGETRRVALGRALAAYPRILFLDEPLTGLDPERRASIVPYIARAVEVFACPAIFVSHQREEIARLADRVLELDPYEIAERPLNVDRTVGQVRSVEDDHVTLLVRGLKLRAKGLGSPGRDVILRVPSEALTLSANDPGRGTAAGRMQAKIVKEGYLMPTGAGPVLRCPPGTHLTFSEGDTVWVSFRSLEVAIR
jgi:molybdate transport system ATP-binding protein